MNAKRNRALALLVPTPTDTRERNRTNYGQHSAIFTVPIVSIEDGTKVRNNLRDSVSGTARENAVADMALRFFVYRNRDNTLDVSVTLEWRDVYSLSFANVRDMAKFAGSVERKLAKLDAELGSAGDWKAGVFRYASALGIKIAAREDGEGTGSFGYDRKSYEIRPVLTAAKWIGEVIAEFEHIIPRRDEPSEEAA